MVALTGDYIEVLFDRPPEFKNQAEEAAFWLMVGRVIVNQMNNKKGVPVVARWKEE